MESEKFDELLSGIRKQLESENIDYVFVVANHAQGKPIEGIVSAKSDNGIKLLADMFFGAVINGEKGPQLFIERIIEDVIRFTSRHLGRRDKNGNDVN